MSDSTNVKNTSGNLAEIENLSVSFMTDAGSIKAIDKVNFTIRARPWSAWSANPVPASP